MPAPRNPRRGRPPKFGRPSQVVAVTLPDEVIRGLRRINHDLGWAIVTLLGSQPQHGPRTERRRRVAELVGIGRGHSLIVVDRALVRRLPGVDLVPLNAEQAFLAVAPGHGLSDIELAVLDRLESGRLGESERAALTALRVQMREWRRDRGLRFHARGIIIVAHARVGRR